MTQFHIQSFQQLFPGPYSLQPGTNGVDSTFDIYCRKSGELIISTDFWYEEERAQRDATVITMALESMRHTPRYQQFAKSLQDRLNAFQADYPGPYESSYVVHDGWIETGTRNVGNEYFIASLATKAEDAKADIITRYIAEALNNLFLYTVMRS